MSDNIKLLATPDDMWKAYRGMKTKITAIPCPGCEPNTIIGWVFPKEMHDFLETMQFAANWYVYAITRPLTSIHDVKTSHLATLTNCVPEFNRWHCALVTKPEYIDRYFVMCSDRVELGILETMFGMDQDGDSVIILKEETISDSDVDDPQPSNLINTSVKLLPLPADMQGRIAEYHQAIVECLQDPSYEAIIAYHELVAGNGKE